MACQRDQRRRLLMEGLESRQLLNAASGTPTTTAPLDPDLFAPQDPRNVGTVVAFQYNEAEVTGQRSANDAFLTAEVLPLGTLPGQEDTIDVNGSMGLSLDARNNIITDIDVYAV